MAYELKDKIETLLSEGKSYSKIANELGISKGQAWKIVHGKGKTAREQDEKENKQMDNDRLELMKRACGMLLRIKDWYLSHPEYVVDFSKILGAYEYYLRNKPEIVLKLWLGIEEAFQVDLYGFLRANVNIFLNVCDEDNNCLLLNHCFAELVGSKYFKELSVIEDLAYSNKIRERKIIEARIKQLEKGKKNKEMIKCMFDIHKMFIERQNNVLFLKETLEMETENGNDNDTISNTGENDKKEGD